MIVRKLIIILNRLDSNFDISCIQIYKVDEVDSEGNITGRIIINRDKDDEKEILIRTSTEYNIEAKLIAIE